MGTQLILMTDGGNQLDAGIELLDDGLVLHGRTHAKNRHYKEALELLLLRLDRAVIDFDIFLNSKPLGHDRHQDRQLTNYSKTDPTTRFGGIVREVNSDRDGNSAWQRLRIRTSVHGEGLRLAIGPSKVKPLSLADLRKAKTKHIDAVVNELRSKANYFGPSREYDAFAGDGTALSTKQVFELALEKALDIKIDPDHFSTGWEQICFNALENAGIWVVSKNGRRRHPNVRRNAAKEKLEGLLLTEEERTWAEGNPKVVSHLKRERQPGLAKAKRAEFKEQNNNRLFCEKCKLDPVAVYGVEAGEACIEVHHHRVFVSKMEEGHQSKTRDLMCLCANCHRALHRQLALGTVILPWPIYPESAKPDPA